jgi:hypothetical protein
MSCMFQVLNSISIQYIRFQEIITCSLNIILIIFFIKDWATRNIILEGRWSFSIAD